MAWIGGRKGNAGGNPSSINKSSGDMPQSAEYHNSALNKDLTAILMGRASGGVRGARSAAGGSANMGIPQDMKLPAWLKTGEEVYYLSRTTGQKVDVIVEMVNTSKCEVEVSSPADGCYRIVPFAVIASAQNPLFPKGESNKPAQPAPFQAKARTTGPALEITVDEDAQEGAAASAQEAGPQAPRPSADSVDLTDAPRARSRSPKR